MAATVTLLKASFFDSIPPVTLPPLKRRRNPILLRRTTQLPLLLLSIKKTTPGFITVQCVMNNNNSKNCFIKEEEEEDDDEERKQNQNPLNKRFAEVILASGVLFLAYDPNAAAIAASGGRMGGQSFSSSSSSSSSSRSSSSSSSSFDDDDDGLFSFLWRSTPSLRYYQHPSPGSPCNCFDVDKGFSSSISSPIGDGESSLRRSCSLSDVIMSGVAIGVVIFIFIAACELPTLITNRSKKQGTSSTTTTTTLTNNTQTTTTTTTVLKLQVGLMGKKRLLQRNLDQIAETADTSTIKGLSYILRDTTLLLLKHPSCCISGYSSVDVKQSIEDGEKLFNRLCIEERGKFDEETLVNIDNNKRQSTYSKGANGVSNEYIVITILVAAKGVHKLPAITGSADLKEALQKLGSISFNKTMAALEVLWTPQEENDTLTEQELHEDYPLLRPLYKDQDTQSLEKC